MILTQTRKSATRINMSIEEVARITGKSKQWARIQLQRKLVNWGTAVKLTGNKFTYFVSAPLLYKSMGLPLPLEYQEKEEPKQAIVTGKYTVITEPVSNIGWRR